MITENTNLWRLGLNSLTKGFGRMLPRSGRQKQSGNGWSPLAVFSAFAATLLAFPQETLAQQTTDPSVMFASDAYTANEEGGAITITVTLSRNVEP